MLYVHNSKSNITGIGSQVENDCQKYLLREILLICLVWEDFRLFYCNKKVGFG